MKRKRLLWLLSPLLILALLIPGIPVSADIPGIPHPFYGTLTIGGSDAPVETVVTAKVGEVQVGSITTTVEGQYGDHPDAYLIVGADISIETGATINFYADGALTDQTYAFSSGADPTELNLTVVDTTAPTVAITSTASDPTNTSPIPMTATFSETVTGFVVGDIVVGNGSAGNFAGGPAVYTFDVTPTADGAVTVDIAAGVAQDAASNPNEAATQFSITYDSVAPTVVITSTATSPTNTSPIPVTATFSETVTGFVLDDIVVGNGAAGNFAGGPAVYTFDVTPTAEGAVTVDIAAGVAQDAATNPNEVATQFSITYDSVAPTVVITSTASDPTNTSPIPITATFSEDVTGFVVGDISVGNGAAGNFAGGPAVYTFDVTPTADGAVTVDIAAGVAQDAATNPNEVATQFSITYDSTAPTVAITSTASSPTSTSPIPVTATFSETVTGFVLDDIVVGNGAAGNFAGGPAVYTFDVTPTAEGAVTVDIAANVAQDAATNPNTAATQFSITYDSTLPTVTIDSVTSPTNVVTQTLTGTITEGVTVVLTADTAATFGTVSYPTTTTWSSIVTLVEGSNLITATADSVTATATIVLDTTAPTVTSTSPLDGATGVAVDTVVTATFSEAMDASTITTSTFTLDSVSGSVSYDSGTYIATFTPSADLTVGTTYTATLSTAITDAAGNALVAASAYSWSFTTAMASLGDLIDEIDPEGTLTLVAGTYTGNVTITQPITITGTVGTIISGGILIEALTGSTVIIENLTITGYTDYGIRIVKVRDVDNFTIRNNTIQGVEGSIIGIEVVEVEAGGSLTIEKNSILGNETGIKLLAAVAAATIKFNDITGNTVGLELVTGGTATVEKNWWGDISGPKQTTTNPRGAGNEVSGSADYQPWLTRQFATVQADNIAYFGYASVSLSTGWNIMSTPIALDTGADTWGEYVALGNPDLYIHTTNPAYYFNASTQAWVALTSDYQLKASDAIYVRMTQADIAPVLYSPNISVPSKLLYAGWNLVGLANLADMSVEDALTSVYRVPGDLTGYSQVVSPSIGGQTAWIYIRDATVKPNMQQTKGYWVFMVNAPTGTTLAGFTFTPMTLY